MNTSNQNNIEEEMKVEKIIDKEKFMQFVSEAFDQGASVDIHFHSLTKMPEEKAVKIAEEFASITGDQVEEAYSSDYKSRWYKTRSFDHHISIWHQNSYDKKGLKKLVEELDKEEELA
jgi:lipoate-protein ligase A